MSRTLASRDAEVFPCTGGQLEAPMNQDHAALCSSPEWAEHIADTVLPAALGAVTRAGGGRGGRRGGRGGARARERPTAARPGVPAVGVAAALANALATASPRVTVGQGSGDKLPFEDG